ncbi:MAG: metal-dependent transcriptional regulator [Bacteroidetes bacterium]|nr:metal-dependent transcriptional regulator [Bacteroidota bacterium]
MNSLTVENYLKALLHLGHESGEVNVNDLSKHLDIKMPTVTSMMKKLAEKDLVHYESYKPVRLTDYGKKEAALIIRKHRLTEMFLVEKMDFGWEEVHDIAEQIEHVKSPLFFNKMEELLGHPKLDPHGSPIPDRDGNFSLKSYNPLSTIAKGMIVHLAAVTNSSQEFLKFLNSRDLALGTLLKIENIEEFDGTMLVSYENHPNETFSKLVCDRLLVEVV